MIVGLWALGATAEAAMVSLDVDPSTAGIQDKIKVQLGDTVTVDVVVDAVTDLNAFEFNLGYIGARLNARTIMSGMFLPGPPISAVEDLGPPLLKYAEFQFSDAASSGTDVVLASIIFDTVGLGTSTLTLPVVKLSGPHSFEILNGSGTGGSITVVPIPGAALLFGTGLIGLIAIARRKSLRTEN